MSTALAGAIVILLGCVALIAWIASQRTARVRAITEDLDEAVRMQQQSSWHAADASLDRAAVRLGDHGPAYLQQPYLEARSDSKLAARLDAIADVALHSTAGVENFAQSAREYRQILSNAGIDVDASSPDAAAHAILNSHIRDRLELSLYEWSFVASEQVRDQLWTILCKTDRDPDGLRNQIRKRLSGMIQKHWKKRSCYFPRSGNRRHSAWRYAIRWKGSRSSLYPF